MGVGGALPLPLIPGYVICIDVSLWQAVQLLNSGDILDGGDGNHRWASCYLTSAITWTRTSFAIITADELREVTDRVLQVIDEFSLDYLAVNSTR